MVAASGYFDTLHCWKKEETSPIVIENKIKKPETEFDHPLVLVVNENDIIDHKLKQISGTILKLNSKKAECFEVMKSKAKEVKWLISVEDLNLTESSYALVWC